MNEFNPDWDQMAVLVEHSQEQAAKIEQLEKKLAEILQDAQPEPYAEQARRVEQETQGRMRINPVTGDVSIGSPPFTTPPAAQREWSSLTDDEIKEIIGPWGEAQIHGYTRWLFDKIDEALRRKNT